MTNPLADMPVGPLSGVLHRVVFRDKRIKSRAELITFSSERNYIRTAYPEKLPSDFLGDGFRVDTPPNVTMLRQVLAREVDGFWVVAHIFQDALDPASCANCTHPEEDHDGLYRSDARMGTEEFYPHGCTATGNCECEEYVPLPIQDSITDDTASIQAVLDRQNRMDQQRRQLKAAIENIKKLLRQEPWDENTQAIEIIDLLGRLM